MNKTIPHSFLFLLLNFFHPSHLPSTQVLGNSSFILRKEITYDHETKITHR